ncbi:TerC family protein, partial [Helicobacter ganmani]
MDYLGFPLHTIAVFTIFVIIALCIDFLGHKDKTTNLKSASIWSIFWVFISILFGLFVYYEHGKEMASLFFAGYILEKSLSVDNLFVIMAIFSWFKIPQEYRHRVLYFGIIGAITFRLIFVAIGSSLFLLASWVQLVFGAIILWTAFAMLGKSNNNEEIEDYSNHLAYKLVYKYFSVFPKIVGHHFFISRKTLALKLQENPNIKFSDKGSIIATPLLLCLCVI